MKYFIYFLTILLLLGLNIGLFSFLKIYGVVPNLLLLLVVIFALYREEDNSFFYIAVLAGLFLDFYTASFLGSFSIAFLILTYLLYLFVHKVVVLEITWKIFVGILAFSMVFVYAFLWAYAALTFKLGWSASSLGFQDLRNRIVIEFFYNLLLLYPVIRYKKLVKDIILGLQVRKNKIE